MLDERRASLYRLPMHTKTDPHGCSNPDHNGLRAWLTTDVVGDDAGQDVRAVAHVVRGLRESNEDLWRAVRRHRFQRGANWFAFALAAAGVVAVLFTFFGK
jgi:hypothetical protein